MSAPPSQPGTGMTPRRRGGRPWPTRRPRDEPPCHRPGHGRGRVARRPVTSMQTLCRISQRGVRRHLAVMGEALKERVHRPPQPYERGRDDRDAEKRQHRGELLRGAGPVGRAEEEDQQDEQATRDQADPQQPRLDRAPHTRSADPSGTPARQQPAMSGSLGNHASPPDFLRPQVCQDRQDATVALDVSACRSSLREDVGDVLLDGLLGDE